MFKKYAKKKQESENILIKKEAVRLMASSTEEDMELNCSDLIAIEEGKHVSDNN